MSYTIRPDQVVYFPIKGDLVTGPKGSIDVIETIQPGSIAHSQLGQGFVITPEALKQDIEMHKDLHIRPMSDHEYEDLFMIIQTNQTKDGQTIFSHERAAIARIIKENFSKFFPDVTLDNIVIEAMNEITEIDAVMREKYFEALNKWRESFITKSAEDVFTYYTPEEKKRLKEKGIAFLDLKIEEDIPKDIKPPIKPSMATSTYIHPMIKYGLIKGK